MKIRPLTLEIVRPGPAHNQQLSPLTTYLALCGNHDAASLHVNGEQAAQIRRQRALRYDDGPRAAATARIEAAEQVTQILADIPALLAELSAAAHQGDVLVHLRLVLSAQELAMLPFELATAPTAFPGEGQPLLLQTIAPVVLTRELRRTGASALRWPVRPNILVIVASPPRVDEVPMAPHLAAIADALGPWLVTDDRDGLAQYITVIQRATLARVREACASTRFTHVHILAHGYPLPDTLDRDPAYGLAFHAEKEAEVDVVSGARLAAALRCHPADGDGSLSSPAVVTVASCDSSNVGGVVTPGADVAHALHEAGIPLVIASQFPLTQRGSVVMAEAIYPRLLRGDDPRAAVHAMRQALQVDCPNGQDHDWASVTVYAAFPADVDAQVRAARFESVKRMLDAALARLDKAEEAQRARGAGEETEADRQQRKANAAALAHAIAELERTPPDDDRSSAQLRKAGALGSAKKRFAHMFSRKPLWPLLSLASAAPGEAAPHQDDIEAQRRSRAHLEEARDHYREAFRTSGSQAWTVVQYLALWAALEPPTDALGLPTPRQREFEAHWTTAHTIASDNLGSPSPQEVNWAHGALMELSVLAQMLRPDHPARLRAADDASAHLEGLLSTAQSRLDAYSMRRQLQRYADWWWLDRPDIRGLPASLAATMLAYGVPRTLDAT